MILAVHVFNAQHFARTKRIKKNSNIWSWSLSHYEGALWWSLCDSKRSLKGCKFREKLYQLLHHLAKSDQMNVKNVICANIL